MVTSQSLERSDKETPLVGLPSGHLGSMAGILLLEETVWA